MLRNEWDGGSTIYTEEALVESGVDIKENKHNETKSESDYNHQTKGGITLDSNNTIIVMSFVF